MTEHLDTSPDNVSRRNLLLGMGAVAGAAAGAGLLTSGASAASPARLALPAAHPHPEALAAEIPGLRYITIDAQAFVTSDYTNRLYGDLTGITTINKPDRVWAALPLPVGSVIYQISVGYQHQPIIEISRRKITQPTPATAPSQSYQKTVPLSPGGPTSSTLNLTGAAGTIEAPVLIEADSSYTVSAYMTPGDSIFNVQIGYLPPTQTFIPFPGTTPRVFDSRLAANGPKFAVNEERTIDLGIAGARTAVINLTVTETAAGGGFVAVFPADIAYPGTSSINWTALDQNIANGVITRVDATGKIKVRANNVTHIVIDRIGYMI